MFTFLNSLQLLEKILRQNVKTERMHTILKKKKLKEQEKKLKNVKLDLINDFMMLNSHWKLKYLNNKNRYVRMHNIFCCS